MTNQEILRKAIEKSNYFDGEEFDILIRSSGQITITRFGSIDLDYYSVIFDHEFAKGLWGEEYEKYYDETGIRHFRQVWEGHLQQMVLKKNPVSYLAKYVEDIDTNSSK